MDASSRAAPGAVIRSVGWALHRARWRADLTQQQVADALGIDRSAVSRWERGERFPTIPHLVAFADLVGRPASAIVADAELRLGAVPPGADPDPEDHDAAAD